MQPVSRHGRTIRRKVSYLLLATFLLVSINACSGIEPIRKYREARQAFNEAAAMENGLKLRGAVHSPDTPELKDDGSAQKLVSITPEVSERNTYKASYIAALALLRSIDSPGEAELEKQEMLMDKLTIEALCLLRLGKTGSDEILPVLNRAQGLSEKQSRAAAPSRTRDSYLMQALPGLIMNDQAYARIPTQIISDTKLFEDLKKTLVGRMGENALKYISDSRQAAFKDDHEIRLYLLQAELAVYRNLMGAYTYCRPESGGRQIHWSDSDERRKSDHLLRCLKTLDTTEGKKVFTTWHTILSQPALGELSCNPDVLKTE
jgi:hypothetical protein